jgi:hypothetical protein
MLRKISILLVVAILLSVIPAHAQQTAPSHKYRTIFTIAGAGGGFVAGMFVGFAKFDDAINSDRKVWTTSLIGAGGGAVGGYFIGRALDRRVKPTAAPTSAPVKKFAVEPILSKDSKGVQFSARF